MNVITPELCRHLFRHPFQAPTLLRAAWRMRRAGWWHLPPYLPVPDPAYWHFRLVTANGTGGSLRPDDMVDAARWALRQPIAGR